MSNNTMVPTLSASGWVSNAVQKADILVTHAFLSEYSQSFIYKGQVTSMPHIVAFHKDIYAVSNELESALTKYLTPYLDGVVVATEVDEKSNSAKGTIHIYVSFTDDEGNQHTLGKLLETENSLFKRFANLNNTGKV